MELDLALDGTLPPTRSRVDRPSGAAVQPYWLLKTDWMSLQSDISGPETLGTTGSIICAALNLVPFGDAGNCRRFLAIPKAQFDPGAIFLTPE